MNKKLKASGRFQVFDSFDPCPNCKTLPCRDCQHELIQTACEPCAVCNRKDLLVVAQITSGDHKGKFAVVCYSCYLVR